MKPASFGRVGGLVAAASLVGACQLAFGLGDYSGATGQAGGPVGAAGYGGGAQTTGGGGTTSSSASGGGAGGTDGTTSTATGCACVDALPAEWSFVHVFRSTKLDGGLSTCGGDVKPLRLYEGPSNAPVGCAPCACGGLAGASCTLPALECGASADCSGNDGLGLGQACKGVSFDVLKPYEAYCKLAGTPAPTGGSCEASGGNETARPTWASVLSLCAAAPQASPACPGSTCVDSAAGADTCVRRDGNAPCSVPGFGKKLDAWTGATDTRSCAACSCSPELSCTGGGYDFFVVWLGGCAQQVAHVGGTDCVHVTKAYGAQGSAPAVAGSCSAQGGQATGTFTPSEQATVCCPG